MAISHQTNASHAFFRLSITTKHTTKTVLPRMMVYLIWNFGVQLKLTLIIIILSKMFLNLTHVETSGDSAMKIAQNVCRLLATIKTICIYFHFS